jgi:predicted NACHT family NTPase
LLPKIQIKIFISCPANVDKEKLIAIEECKNLSRIFSSRIVLEVVEWKQNTVPLITGENAQSIINKQIQDDYDIYIGILWNYFGTKQSNGLTPTEEEFERAFNRYKSTKKPLISVYFKTDNLPNPDSEQMLAVEEFKRRIGSLGFYNEFKEGEFREKILHDIGYKLENWFSLTNIQLKKPIEENKNYLKRKVASTKDYNSFGLILPNQTGDLLDIIQTQTRIVLLGDAGVGKTTELERIAWHFSKEGSPLFPIFLSLNKYVNQDLSELLGDSWTAHIEHRTLVILDGLDEVEAKNKNDAIRKIELFADEHPSCKILISCRRNFYNQEKGEDTGTLVGFLSYVLLDLDYQETKNYVERELDGKADAFFNSVQDARLGVLLKVPFYLVSLVKLFQKNKGILPDSKNEIFEYLLNDRLRLDATHFRTTIELDQNKGKILSSLQRLGLAMNILGKNYVSEEEFIQIISKDELRNLLKYCTAWKRNDGDAPTWQFEHNNFQEYLAARALSDKPLEVVKECISFEPEYKKIIPFWTNTLSFLINMPRNDALLAWILEIQPELMVKIEPYRIENKIRENIFKRVFNEYKQKRIWIPFDKYDYRELARFGQSEEMIKFLTEEVEKATDYTTCCNAIELLGNTDGQFDCNEIRAVLVKVVTSDNENFQKQEAEQVKAQALIALAKLGLGSREIIGQIVSSLASSPSDLIRSGLFYLINKSDFLEDYLDILLENIQNIEYNAGNDGVFQLGLTEERRNLIIGLQKARSKKSIEKILLYLIKNNDKLSHHSLLDTCLANIAENAAAFANDQSIFELAINFVSLLCDAHEKDDIDNFLGFFDKSGNRVRAFSEILSLKTGNYMNTLSLLADKECLNSFADQYLEGKISEKEVWWFQNLLSLNNHDLFLPFNQLINEKSGNKFILPPKRDFEAERKNRTKMDIQLLFDKSQFLNKIKSIFEKEQKDRLTKEEVIQIMTHRWNDESSSDLAIHTLLQITKKEPVSVSEVLSNMSGWNWDLFCISEVYRYFDNGQLEVTKEQSEWIANWCYSNINKVDFKTALKRKDEKTSTTSYTAIYLWFFLRKLNLSFPKNVLLDMFSFDWLDKNSMVGTKYLEERLDKKAIRERILENLAKGIEIDDVLENHLEYCARNKVIESIPFAISEIKNTKRKDEVRISALDCLYISTNLDNIEMIISQFEDDFKWTVISSLIKNKSKNIGNILKEILEHARNEDEKIKASMNLVELGDLGGLPFYIEWIERHETVPETLLDRLQRKSPLESLVSIEAIPFLVKLLEISYEDAFRDKIPSLHDTVVRTLAIIGLQTDDNYLKVRQEILKFIACQSDKIEGVSFLHNYLDDLEKSFYIQKSSKLSLDQIIGILSKFN